jgi:hypothetical protein
VLTISALRKRLTRARVKLENDSQASFTKPELDTSAPTAGPNTPDDGLQIYQRDPDALEARLEIDCVERRGDGVCGELHGIYRMPTELSGQTKFPPELAGVIAAAELPHGGNIQREVYEVSATS